jgi:hypothetical protein
MKMTKGSRKLSPASFCHSYITKISDVFVYNKCWEYFFIGVCEIVNNLKGGLTFEIQSFI